MTTHLPINPAAHRRWRGCAAEALGFLAVLLLGQIPGSLKAQSALSEAMLGTRTNSARSVSGQFLIHGVPPNSRGVTASELANRPEYLEFAPALAAVACERIKHALAAALEDNSPWKHKIHIFMYPAERADDGGAIIAEQFRDGWNYRVELPRPIERARFTRAIVQTLLLERAGRNAREHAPEVPDWLAAGLTEYLLKGNENELLPPPARTAVNGLLITSMVIGGGEKGALRTDPLADAYRTLRERAPLTLAELNWPTPEQMDGPDSPAYRSSAQLLVTELLRLKDGRAGFRAMLDELATCYNWQTAFFRGFHRHFERQVDLEKWWALQVAYFTGRNPAQTWSTEESWNKLDELLRTEVSVRHAADELPDRGEISLTIVIREWDSLSQSRTLRAKLRELELLRLRVGKDLIRLVDDYRSVLSAYLERRNRSGLVLTGKLPYVGMNSVVRDTLRQIAALEERREELRPKPVAISSVGGDAPALPEQ